MRKNITFNYLFSRKDLKTLVTIRYVPFDSIKYDKIHINYYLNERYKKTKQNNSIRKRV